MLSAAAAAAAHAPKNVVIIGGVAGGASAAARLRRLDKNAKITIFEKGPFAAFANCGLPYFVGDLIPNEKKLIMMSPTVFDHKFNISVRSSCEVTFINREKKEVHFVNHKTQTTGTAPYDDLILAPGSKPFRPKVEGLDLPGVFGLSTIPDARAIRGLIWNDSVKSATVVGSGFIGLETVENLHRRGLSVNLIEMADQVFPAIDHEMASLVEQNLRKNGIELRLQNSLTGIARSPESQQLNVHTSCGSDVKTDLVVLALGVQPNSSLASAAGLSLGATNAIQVDEQMRTSDAHIYACGDAVEVRHVITGKSVCLPLAGPANRQARVVAEAIVGGARGFRGVQGTSVCGCFGQTIAMTGLTEKAAKRLDIPYETIYIHNGQHAEYYPGSVPLHLKLLFQKSGRILGAQAVGTDGVEKRIDVISTMIQMKGSVHNLMESELCYAPQYGSAKDPANVLGMIASNVVDGLLKLGDWNKVHDNFVLDVRNPGEVREGTIAGAVNIPQCDVPQRLDELPKDRPIYVLCREGYRAYNICRLLTNSGFDSYLLSGGLHTYRMLHGETLHKGGAGCRPEGVGCCPRAAKFA